MVETAIQIMVIKSLFPFILSLIILVLIFTGIQRCSIEQNDDMACKVTEEYVLWKLNLPYSAQKTFTYSEITYVGTGKYLIYGSIKVEYVNKEVNVKHFRSIVKAHGNNESDFDVTDLEFIKDKE
jgi:hypothetical protein